MRSRLNERLTRATRFPVTLLCAAAGFGKTTALRDFIESARFDAVRFDVRPEDDTLFAFARGLSESLGSVAPSIEAAYPAAHERLLSSPDPVRDLTNWFDAHLRKIVCTIVVDDLHHAMTDDRVAQLLTRLVERTRSRIAWIFATRGDAGIPVASWIGYGLMDTPILEEDLRFSMSEALAHAGSDDAIVTIDDVRALHALTEGWPVALTIALRTRTHAADFPSAARGARHLIYRYLAEQIFERMPDAERELLLATSVFPAFDLAVIHSLGASTALWDSLRQSISFIVRADEAIYRYHDLFRAFLEDTLERRGGLNAALHKAATVVEKTDPSLALAFATRSLNAPLVLQLIEQHGLHLIERGETEVVSGALQTLSETERSSSAIALVALAVIQSAYGHFDLAQPLFRAAIERSGNREQRAELAGRYAIELVRAGCDCEDAISEFVGDPGVSQSRRVSLLGTLATSFGRAGDSARAIETMEQAIKLLDIDSSDETRARLMQQATFVFHLHDPERALRYARIAVDLSRAQGHYEVAARAYSGIYAILYGKDDVLGALAALDSLLECARMGASNQVALFGLIATLGIEVERANDIAIEASEIEIRRISADLPRTSTETLLPARAMRAAWSGNWTQAYTLLAGSEHAQPRDDFTALRLAEIALFASASGRSDECAQAVRDATSLLAKGAPSARSALAYALLALAELTQGHTAAANRYIDHAERIGSAFLRMRTLASSTRTVYRLAMGHATEPELSAALERLRSQHFGGMARLIEALPTASPAKGGYPLLTASERDILEHLARGASTKDIASQTGRSPQTVDTHIRSICRKLGCSGRRAAVALAHEQGWVKSYQAGDDFGVGD
jgi:LuxR family maltose regulon positive regulatory protein